MRKRLASFRYEKSKTLEEMSKEIGVSQSFYEKIEYGDKNPSFNFIKKFKKTFPDANVEYIFFGQ